VLDIKGDLGQAREIMRQLGIEGEILWTTTRPNAGESIFKSGGRANSFSSKPTWLRIAPRFGKWMSTCGE
jgi:hypothetical protein